MMRCALLLALVACADPSKSTTMRTHDHCDGKVVLEPILDSPHQEVGTPIVWPYNPPTSGPHWPVWAQWNRDYTEIPRGYWLHNAEHGGVVFGYRCSDGCPEVQDALDALVRALPADPHCEAPLRNRAIVVADPLMPDDHAVYAIAWGTYYEATCVDEDALTGFYMDNFGRSTENTCADGGYYDGTPLY